MKKVHENSRRPAL